MLVELQNGRPIVEAIQAEQKMMMVKAVAGWGNMGNH